MVGAVNAGKSMLAKYLKDTINIAIISPLLEE